jgi:hypothetical protein
VIYVNPNIWNGVERNGRIGNRVYFIKSNVVWHVTTFVDFRGVIYDGYLMAALSSVTKLVVEPTNQHKTEQWTTLHLFRYICRKLLEVTIVSRRLTYCDVFYILLDFTRVIFFLWKNIYNFREVCGYHACYHDGFCLVGWRLSVWYICPDVSEKLAVSFIRIVVSYGFCFL